MKKIIALSFFVFFISCNKLIEKPENLISKEKMTDVLIDLALNEQSNLANPKSNMELGTRYVLQKHHIKTKDFIASYQYYALNKDLENMLGDAQEKLKKRYPELQQKIEAQEQEKELLKENPKQETLDSKEKVKPTEELKDNKIKEKLGLPEPSKNKLKKAE